VPVARIGHPVEAADRDDVDAYTDVARSTATLLVPSTNVARRVDTLEPYGAFNPGRIWPLADAFGPRWARAFRRFGLTHVVLPVAFDVARAPLRADAIDGGTLVGRDDARGYELWAVPHRPWAFFALGAMPIARPEWTLDAVLALVDRGNDRTVAVEADPPVETAPGRVLRVERGSESVVVEAESAAPALLVVQDAFWPGWRAWIDGLSAEILPVDHLVRGVRWPPGRHRLEMSYEPPGVRLGLWLSALGAALVVLLSALEARRPHVTPPGRGAIMPAVAPSVGSARVDRA
jgi:hypothetical protein